MFIWSIYAWKKFDDRDYFLLLFPIGTALIITLTVILLKYFYGYDYVLYESVSNLIAFIRIGLIVIFMYIGYKILSRK